MNIKIRGGGYQIRMGNGVTARLYDATNPLVATIVEKFKAHRKSCTTSIIPTGYVLQFTVDGEPIYFAYWRRDDLSYLALRLQKKMEIGLHYAYFLMFRGKVYCTFDDDAHQIIDAAIANVNPFVYRLLAEKGK